MKFDSSYAAKPVAFNVMLKPIGPVCNLDCTYCYYLEKKNIYKGKKNSDFRMPDNVLEKYIKEYIDSQQVPVVSFIWQGGEPTLLGIDYYRKIVELQKKYAGNKRVENSFQTNATLLDDEWCKFFKENNFLIGVSIDGSANLHDYHRTYKDGDRPSHQKVMEGIKLLKRHGVEFNTLTVVNKYNSYYPLEVYNFLKSIGSTYIQFIPIVERVTDEPDPESVNLIPPSYKGNAHVTEWSVEPLQYGKFLTTIFDEWVRNDVGRFFVQLFDVTLANWVGERPGLCVFGETCGDALVMEHNGDIYSCDHFVYEDYYLGNIMERSMVGMVTSLEQIKFGSNKRDLLPGYCMECDYRFACHGECPKHRFMKTPEGEDGLNYLCPAYKIFFEHVHPYMQYMGDELKKKRPPANVMNWVRRIDEKKDGKMSRKRSIGRNDPCPCGSGRKYKNCCIHVTRY